MMSQGEFDRAFNGLTLRRREVLEKFLAGETDKAIAKSLYISQATVRQHIKAIAEAFGFENEFSDQRRSKRPELIALFAKYKPELLGNSQSAIAPPLEVATAKSQETAANTGEQIHNLDAAQCKSNFVGRENAIARLNTLIRQGSKVILIQAPGGVGKTTLAQEYLKSQGFDLILELLMAKEKENITLVESVIEEWLKRDFQEEPGREFGVTLGRLKRELQKRRVGILIDNLEPALDGQGRFIEPHRRYGELLRVLADSSVQSVTLITSREPLAECVGVTNYPLPSLDEKAWQDFFSRRDIEIDEITLKEMHKAYGGNALAMTILCDPIERDGGMVAYWQQHKVEADLLVELAVENLVKDQFNRLEQTSPEAYRLLCRLGCYRYQDVPTVPTEGLLSLLWDVPEAQRRRVIESLRNRSLVECFKGEYWLHPVIRAEAISRLRESEDWKITNQTAAKFWTESVKTVETIADAKKALEAYYHYFEIKEFDLAGRVFVIRRSNKWTKYYRGEFFGGSLYRFGLLQQTISEFNQIIDKILLSINTADLLIQIYLSIGDIHYAKGEPNRGIDYHKKSQQIASSFSENTYKNEEILEVLLKDMDLVSFVNIGYGYIYLWEIETAKKSFENCYFATKNTELHHHSVDACYFLAFCNSCLGLNQEAHNLAENAYGELSITEWQPWSHGCALVFLGFTYKNLREIPKAFEMFQRAIKFAEDSYYIQIKGQAFSGLAELYRIQGEFETALSHHSESIELLDKIGAKCDLAEAYYQLGLTYQTIGNTADSQENFNKAIQLFREMEAPRQIEKVQQAAGKLI
ncbi:MAG TPA: tetratricopeptide repeat protein [Kamptonema sp.]|nr:tetratricopeptide repeat protein [Kamptonema sp.]